MQGECLADAVLTQHCDELTRGDREFQILHQATPRYFDAQARDGQGQCRLPGGSKVGIHGERAQLISRAVFGPITTLRRLSGISHSVSLSMRLPAMISAWS